MGRRYIDCVRICDHMWNTRSISKFFLAPTIGIVTMCCCPAAMAQSDDTLLKAIVESQSNARQAKVLRRFDSDDQGWTLVLLDITRPSGDSATAAFATLKKSDEKYVLVKFTNDFPEAYHSISDKVAQRQIGMRWAQRTIAGFGGDSDPVAALAKLNENTGGGSLSDALAEEYVASRASK